MTSARDLRAIKRDKLRTSSVAGGDKRLANDDHKLDQPRGGMATDQTSVKVSSQYLRHH